jgi:uncharacterized protein involved in outer membrane biogenesis
MSQQETPTSWKQRLHNAGAWFHTHMRQFGERLRAAPWKRIGVWTGGVFGVLVATLVLFVTFADWNALKGPIGRFASAATGREIVIRGDLDVNPWSWTPEIRVTQLSIGNPARYRARGAFAEVAQAEAAVRLLPLFVGRFDFARLDLNGADIRLYRNPEGDANWRTSPNPGSGRQINLPAIREFSVREGRVRLEDDKRRMELDATFTTQESTRDLARSQFALSGEGRINNRPFMLELTGAPLLNVRRDRPYPFQADVRAGPTHIVAEGSIRRPFDFNAWSANIRGQGADLADLYALTGLALPNTPPYNLTGHIERAGQRYAMRDINGRVGDSDLSGAFTASRQRNERLLLDGDFRTRNLDFDDLMAVFGGSPDTGETASAEQRAVAANLDAQDRLLPDARLDISRVRNMDARVSYRAARVRSETVPLRGLALDISLDNGLLRLDPMTLDLRQGRVAGTASINARQEMPLVNVDVRLTGARMESIFMRNNVAALSGPLHGRARLTGRGASVRQAAANASGAVSFVAPSGEVREAFAELTGINVTRGLGLLLTEDQSTTAIRCGVASFRVRDGVATAESLVFDTEDVLIRGGGTVNLRDETLNLDIQGHPKEPRLVRIAAPIEINGHLRSPQIGVEAGGAVAQGGIAAALGALVAPLAAILPFVDAGLAEDANCAALLAGREHTTREG